MSAIRLFDLIHGLPISGGEADERQVLGVSHDSRRVEAGDLFVAIPGAHHDGRDFAPQAVAAGAVAALGRGARPEGLGVPWLEAADPRALLATLAARTYRRPDRELVTVGVTGTNGKSTVAILAAGLLEAAGRPAGLIGSLVYRFGSWSRNAERTTPEASDLFRLLRSMCDEGAAAVAMEVSSHALELGRVAELTFDVAVFTNLSRDHFDFHRGFEGYFAAKRKLFGQLKPGGAAVVNAADPWGQRLLGELEGRVRTISYGAGGQVDLRHLELGARGTELTAQTPRGEVALESRLVGRFNAENLLAAVAVAEALEIPPETTIAALGQVDPIPGRMEPVDRGQAFPIYIDYSHTEAALQAALASVREVTGCKVILVFGCGGDRDPGKRKPMGRIAGESADLPILTSDNPRTEDPVAILRAVEEGLKESGNTLYRVVPDRREAIRRAVAVAGPESVVLVAGKGNEAVQIVGREARPFLDREEIESALEETLGTQKPG